MAGKVLDKGPSDHRPFIQDFIYDDRSGGFRVATVNVHHSTTMRQAYAHMDEVMAENPSVILMQEVKPRQGLEDYFRNRGWGFAYAEPEFAIAWDKSRWDYKRERRIQMSPIRYWTINYALLVVLEDLEVHKRGKFMTYHPPAKVQRPNEPQHKKVLSVLRDVVKRWNRIARNDSDGRIDFACFGGDDNVDEYRGYKPKGGWAFMTDGPLRQVRAPEPTHGRKRRIDDFRVWGIRPN